MRARLLAFATTMMLGAGVTACGTPELKADGEPCFASSECDVGLTCDFGSDPPVCRGMQSAPPPVTPDAGTVSDGGAGAPDAGAGAPDAGAGTPDAAPGAPDAAPVPPDAAPIPPDAAPIPPDAAV
jgi:hypothetical protein